MSAGGDNLGRGHAVGERSAAQFAYQPLVAVVVALAAGIVLDRYGRPELLSSWGDAAPTWLAAWWLGAAACLACWWAVWRRRREVPSAWLLLVAVALSGAAWHDLCWNFFSQHEIARFARARSRPACVEVIAGQAPARMPAPRPTALRPIPTGERSRLDVSLAAIRDGTRWLPASGNGRLVVDGPLSGVRAGDRLQVFARLRGPSPPRSPGESDFAEYARAERRLVLLRSESAECVTVQPAGGVGAGLEQAIDLVRRQGRQLIDRFVGPQRAGLAAAILLGSREGMPSEESTSYMITGTIHVLVVSGLHVGILAMGLYGLAWFGWLPRRAALATIVVVVVLYALVADARPPVVRAAVLTVLWCVAAWGGRRSLGFNLLATAALVILAVNPADLFRVGPQLSFLAVATLMWVERARLRRRGGGDRLDELIAAARPWWVRAVTWFGRWTSRLWIAIGAVWLATLPLVLYRFHVVTPVAVVISPIVWLLVLAALWSGFVMLVCGWLIAPLGAVAGGVCNASLAGLERLVDWAGTVPSPGHFWAPAPAWWWVLVFYLALLTVTLWGRRLVAPRWQLAGLCIWILVGVAPPLARAATRDQIDVSFVAVGHGTCVVLEAPGGETVLYDAGALASPQAVTQTIADYLWYRGIWHVDAIVLSHADVDHYNAVPGLLERFRVGVVYVSPMMFDGFGTSGDSRALGELHAAIDGAGVPIREIWSGDRLRVGAEVAVEVLHPPRRSVLVGDNANSVALSVEYAGRRVLLPGDLESPGLNDLLAELPLDCDILMAPHHGSRRSDPPGLAAWSTPEWVVVSGPAGADVALVTRTYVAAGARVLHTYDNGTVALAIAGDRPISVRSYRE